MTRRGICRPGEANHAKDGPLRVLQHGEDANFAGQRSRDKHIAAATNVAIVSII